MQVCFKNAMNDDVLKGWTWNQIATGSNVYEYADHGALSLLVDLVEATNTISYVYL